MIRSRRGFRWPRLAPQALRLSGLWVLLALTISFLCLWGLGVSSRPVGAEVAQAPILVAGLVPAAAIVPAADGGELSLASGQSVRIRGHAGPIKSAAAVDGGAVLLTTDAYGVTRQTPLPPQLAFAMLEPAAALARLDANLVAPLRAWTGASLPAPLQQNALWAALASALLALGAFAAPQALALLLMALLLKSATGLVTGVWRKFTLRFGGALTVANAYTHTLYKNLGVTLLRVSLPLRKVVVRITGMEWGRISIWFFGALIGAITVTSAVFQILGVTLPDLLESLSTGKPAAVDPAPAPSSQRLDVEPQ